MKEAAIHTPFRSALLGLLVMVAPIRVCGETNDSPGDAARTFAAASSRTASLQSYKCKLHVDVRMRSFPYLVFHLTGHVSFARPNLYSVHFDRVPWFAKGSDNIEMNELEPATWPDHYDFVSLSHEEDRTSVEMRERGNAKSPRVLAELDTDGLRRIQWLYPDGDRIELYVNFMTVNGIPVPAIEDADIRRPTYHILAHASFTDYEIVTDSANGDL
jgi:hypothetical protein